MEDRIMKKFYFVLAVLAMASLTGCQINEFERDTYVPKKGEIVFRLANSNTRSADVNATVQGVSIPLGKDGTGNELFLEETITRLGDISYESFESATRGTPAYTENFSDLYGDFKAAAFRTSGSNFEASAFDDGVFESVGSGVWKRKFIDDVKDQFPLYFFLRAPYDQEGVAVTNLKYNTSNGSITFDYDGSSLTSASAQKDLLFTSRKVEQSDYDALVKKSEAIPVLFHHALTGIKFANFFDNPDLQTKTYITKVVITGLADGGQCVLTPRQETDGYVDDKTDDFSSKTVAVWDPAKLTYGENVSYTQTFDGANDEIDFAENGSFGTSGSYAGTSFDDAATQNNLNKADGSLTFWFVPQQLTENTKMTISYKVINTANGGKTHEDEDTIAFGDMTRKQTKNEETGEITYGAYATWKAGELRTYTLKPRYIEVELIDKMSEDKFTKSDVKISNNGNVYEYVRVNLIGNWVGKVQTKENVFTDEYTILFGYAAQTGDARVEAWNDKDGKTNYGTFEDLVPKSSQIPATADSTYNNWVRYDKYYYYIEPIGPNQSVTADVFKSYTVGVSPEFWIPDQWGVRRKAGEVHLIMDVIVQAIPAATDAAGNITDDYISAWVRELDKNSPQDLLDL
jgi:hypothetical protein